MIDKFEKYVLITTGIVVMLFIFSIVYAKTGKRADMPNCIPFDKTFTTPAVKQIDSNLYQVYVVAQMWQFQPAEIYIPVGSTVDFYLTSKDVVHGFNIYNMNVNMMAVFGAINKATVKFDKPGTYTITCHEYCGVGHHNMQGEVIVNYPEAKAN